MIAVFHPLDSLEAHAVRIFLAGEGIDARVRGDYLQGALGELPALGTLEVVVPEADAERARRLLATWKEGEPDEDWIPPALR